MGGQEQTQKKAVKSTMTSPSKAAVLVNLGVTVMMTSPLPTFLWGLLTSMTSLSPWTWMEPNLRAMLGIPANLIPHQKRRLQPWPLRLPFLVELLEK